jgi:hypothetical protein
VFEDGDRRPLNERGYMLQGQQDEEIMSEALLCGCGVLIRRRMTPAEPNVTRARRVSGKEAEKRQGRHKELIASTSIGQNSPIWI